MSTWTTLDSHPDPTPRMPVLRGAVVAVILELGVLLVILGLAMLVNL